MSTKSVLNRADRYGFLPPSYKTSEHLFESYNNNNNNNKEVGFHYSQHFFTERVINDFFLLEICRNYGPSGTISKMKATADETIHISYPCVFNAPLRGGGLMEYCNVLG